MTRTLFLIFACFQLGFSLNYISYRTNPNEGFNLRRDVYVRFANLMWALNLPGAFVENDERLTLILPRWTYLPHWQEDSSCSLWRQYFNLSIMQEYIDVVDADGGPTGDYDLCLHLGQDLKNQTFRDKACPERIKSSPQIGCSTIRCVYGPMEAVEWVGILRSFQTYNSVAFLNGEQLIHGRFSEWSLEYWMARRSLKFTEQYEAVVRDLKPQEDYLCVHWRRGDYARGSRSSTPGPLDARQQIMHVQSMFGLKHLYLATDASTEEIALLNVSRISPFCVYKDCPCGSGGKAIVDQIICSEATFFIGSNPSTFTFRIVEERQIRGHTLSSSANVFCPRGSRANLYNNHDQVSDDCDRLTPWPMKLTKKDEL